MSELPKTHVVAHGDTLSDISASHNVPWTAIAAANGIDDPLKLPVGKTLTIPTLLLPPPVAETRTPPVFGPHRTGSPVMACEPADIPPCCVTSLVVRCGHSERTFTLRPPDTKTDANWRQVIQVIADSAAQPPHDVMEIVLAGGPCVRGKPTGAGKSRLLTSPGDGVGLVPAVTLGPVRGLSPFKVALAGPDDPPLLSIGLVEFLKTELGDERARRAYSGSVDCCQGGGEFGFTVEVFRPRSWSGAVTLGFERNVKTKLKDPTDQGRSPYSMPKGARAVDRSLVQRGSLTFAGEIIWKTGGRSTKVELPSLERGTSAGRQPFPLLEKFYGAVLPTLASMNSELDKISIQWPHVTLEGGAELSESKTEYRVARKGKLSFKATPFIGLSAETDILDWLILMFPAAKPLNDLRKVAAKGGSVGAVKGSATIALNLTVSGSITGGMDYEWIGDGSHNGSGEISGQIVMQLEGIAALKGEVFTVEVETGVNLKGETGFGGKLTAAFLGDDPGVSGQLFFDGLTISSAAYLKVGGGEVSPKKTSGGWFSKKGILGRSKPVNGASVQEESKLLNIVVIGPASWPTRPTPSSLSEL